MNQYEERSKRERKSTLRFSLLMGVVGLGLAGLALAGLGVITAAPQHFWSKAIVIVAVLLLVIRQIMRRLNAQGKSRAAEPDPQSRLKLNDAEPQVGGDTPSGV